MAEKSIYNSLSEWRNKDPGGYKAALRNKLVEKICDSFGWKYKKQMSNGYWTLDKCKKEALKFKTRSEWEKICKKSYKAATTKKWIDECCQHMIELKKPSGYWTLEKCKKEASKFKTRSEWAKLCKKSYQAATTKKWIDECCQHMRSYIIWTLETCKKEALKYQTKKEWMKKGRGSYAACVENGWIKQCDEHMIELKKQNAYWTLEKCKEEACKYTTRTEWSKNSISSYQASCKNNWLDDCCQHMIELQKPNGYWTKEKCKEEALKYKGNREWCKKNGSSYNCARKNNWLDECCQHMKK